MENITNSTIDKNNIKKKLIIINGTMGSGKTATCRLLNKKLHNSGWLDGDWCYQINPFVVNEENKRMVEDNISHVLRNLLNNSSLEYVIFNWVIHKEEIMAMVLKMVEDLDFQLYKISLTCSKEALRERMTKDVEKGLRDEKQIEVSLGMLSLYEELQTIKIDTSELGVEETVARILEVVL